MRSLTMHWQALAVAHSTIAAQINQALDIQADFTAKVAFDPDARDR